MDITWEDTGKGDLSELCMFQHHGYGQETMK